MQFEDKMTVEEMPFDEMSLGKVASCLKIDKAFYEKNIFTT
jgi:hypothetical protein